MLLLESLQNLNDLLDPFALAEHNFRKACPQRAMMIQPGVPEILKRQITQSIESTLDSARSGAHFI
jgi:hypothetical protein